MRLCRYNDNRIGVVRGGLVHDVTGILNELPAARYPYPVGDPLIARLDALRPKMEKLADAATGVPIASVRFLAPVSNPTKIMGTPVNYKAHAEEGMKDASMAQHAPMRPIEEQGLFLKANSALVGPSEGVAVRFPDRRTDHEAELGVIIGRTGSDIPYDKAFDYIAGYCIALDMVVRGPEDRSFRKSIDSYAVAGPWLVTRDEIPDPERLDFFISVGGTVKQKSNTSLMVMNIARQISWGSTFYTLHPGDVLMTGTCEGVAQVKPGDVMHIEIDRIGAMDVPVRAHR
ncbi:MAG: fumarylacetoacetate hydrolase family protein [Alphaproteobacteria bacterium]|nr:fumarylacetoacetate hydrolase family protein [Alphaproteobacteria bacterium]